MQSIAPSLISNLFRFTNYQQLILDEQKIGIHYKDKSKMSIDIAKELKRYDIQKGVLANKLILELNNGRKIELKGFPSAKIRVFRQDLDKMFAHFYYLSFEKKCENILLELPNIDVYWRKEHFKKFLISLENLFQDFEKLSIDYTALDYPNLSKVEKILEDKETYRVFHNNRFIKNEEHEYAQLFDTIESNPLTSKQREAVVTYEKNVMVIAGAGSGKTSVMVAKTGYLIKRYHLDPSKILLLAFNKKASEELEQRIDKKLGYQVKASTFHAIGLEIIAEVEGKKPSLGVWAEDDKQMDSLLNNIIEKQMQTDKGFASTLLKYFQTLFYNYRSEFEFETLGEYIDYIKTQEIRSLNGDKVKSYEECEIANFLFMNQIPYMYEPAYEYNTASKEFRQYQPDFYLPDYGIYIEHFGINDRMETAPYINQEEYLEGMVYKRALHRHHNTILVETYSCEKQNGMLTANLQKKLAQYNVAFQPLSQERALALFQEKGLSNQFTKLCKTFLGHYKGNNHTIEALKTKTTSLKEPQRAQVFLALFSKIYQEYEEHQTKNSAIDFNDMINKAIGYVETGKYHSPYTHILVDEFQDISTTRAQLVKALSQQYEDSALCVVGDDWQAINRFAGSDISIMRNFEKIYGESEIVSLDYTFRYNNAISELSQSFIERNPSQIHKEIKTIKTVENKAIFVWWDTDIIDSLRSMFNTIRDNTQGKEFSVMILGRYWHILPKQELHQLETEYSNLTLHIMSVHASKGLEADYVVILGNEIGKYGFPSSMEDDPILDLVLAESEPYEYAEERRLFYVALTRAKKEVHLFTSKTQRSVFIEEILEENSDLIEEIGFVSAEQESCPKCKTGKLLKRFSQKNEQEFFGCSNYPYCDFIKKVPKCPKCGFNLKINNDKTLYLCENDTCEYSTPSCQRCGAIMVYRKGNYGSFYGCSNYPECTFTLRDKQKSQNNKIVL